MCFIMSRRRTLSFLIAGVTHMDLSHLEDVAAVANLPIASYRIDRYVGMVTAHLTRC